MIGAGENLPNHTTSLAGLGRFVRATMPAMPIWRTKQSAYRFCAWVMVISDIWLPDEENPSTFDEVLEAVKCKM